MTWFIVVAAIILGIIFYTMMAGLVYAIMQKRFNGDEMDDRMGAAFWPVTILFVAPLYGVYTLLKYLTIHFKDIFVEQIERHDKIMAERERERAKKALEEAQHRALPAARVHKHPNVYKEDGIEIRRQ